jgi:hypothetical protein
VADVQAAGWAHAAYYAFFSNLVPGRQTLFLSSTWKLGALRSIGAATAAGHKPIVVQAERGLLVLPKSARHPSKLKVNAVGGRCHGGYQGRTKHFAGLKGPATAVLQT